MLKTLYSDVVIIGGSLGGVSAALAAAKSGKSVIMTEDTHWIGGQLTNQAVPPDEHPWIEQFGCTASYRNFRNKIRDYYKTNYPVTEKARNNIHLNPGNAWVGKVCHEPKAALSVLNNLLAPYISAGKVTILTSCKAVSVETLKDKIISVTIRNFDSLEEYLLVAPYFLDATECGDLLPLSGTEYITGSESIEQTGELHALPGNAEPLDMQAITWCFAVDYIEGEDHTIDKPKDYEYWKNYKADFWPDKNLSWQILVPHTLQPRESVLFPHEDKLSLWEYRRIVDKNNFEPGTFQSDITLVNWPQNDYWIGPIFELSAEEVEKHLDNAKQLSLSLLYWLQTEAPRPDGKTGYPGLRLRKDIVGTEDGLAMQPYIRESRRIKAEFTILEQHIGEEMRQGKTAEEFKDSVGIGCYRIDLHPSTGGRSYVDISSLPFQIPLGSLIPIRMNNLLAACKNIGTTHITNGCYRLHPVEWNIGEASGYTAAFCLEKNITPRELRNNETYLKDFQALLIKQGIEIEWPALHPV
ncbi:FAD-dependent oxidoreductase [Clostridium swellfunianum]|uniref:FAD-dependent oxidoreductase n=1 Tax=Clostridium swellfunianum TaxID=1367462 RepID=UPI00202E411A|nr:FAD-dependent oxidoreductase [Clostridium swellfunianum]MCM0647567.1 FAD-dependent oxidoreductase [Clostridium swellfunianum]